ncbi:hypothetical protein AX774_g6238 [Zancudomyces culisetae]|uniref:Uncharacterized protein n=1 Tax=Zancudomyces culisetae TaxID=1213189 RepID=A0A1R1PER1_ZANCU|nr:hypothetical protein AX774_g7180 [Zancudomyces culisetae]OMH80331.1 hypothetical protein AX774_g6238 [Zancudomyces culisetae]|eukprot:OMH79408.1 hypothetical protein AX774_g7180 [Zancudomyces culisetae]
MKVLSKLKKSRVRGKKKKHIVEKLESIGPTGNRRRLARKPAESILTLHEHTGINDNTLKQPECGKCNKKACTRRVSIKHNESIELADYFEVPNNADMVIVKHPEKSKKMEVHKNNQLFERKGNHYNMPRG